MSTLGHAPNDRYRAATSQITPMSAPKRMTCSVCHRHQSTGQYEVGEDICITCNPKPAGWRRGGIDKAQFSGDVK